MIAALLAFAIASSDLVGWGTLRVSRERAGRNALLIALAGWAVLLGVLSVFLIGPWAMLVAMVAILWPILTSRWVASALAFVVVVALSVFIPQELIPSGFAAGSSPVGWYAIQPLAPEGSGTFGSPSALDVVNWAQVVMVVAVALFLGLTANLLCRGALDRARVVEGESAQPKLGEALQSRWAAASRTPGQLRGGRLIGPLERWLIVALVLSGMQAIIAALMAAKGIVRFPEISKNSGEGAKAEEFLVGSLISWGLAGAGAVLIIAV